MDTQHTREIVEALDTRTAIILWSYVCGSLLTMLAFSVLTFFFIKEVNVINSGHAAILTAVAVVNEKSSKNETDIKEERASMLKYIAQSLDYLESQNKKIGLKVPKPIPPPSLGVITPNSKLDRPEYLPPAQAHGRTKTITKRIYIPRKEPDKKPWYDFFKTTR
jgi:hypothetical protein